MLIIYQVFCALLQGLITYILPLITRLAKFKFASVDTCDGGCLYKLDQIGKLKYAYVTPDSLAPVILH